MSEKEYCERCDLYTMQLQNPEPDEIDPDNTCEVWYCPVCEAWEDHTCETSHKIKEKNNQALIEFLESEADQLHKENWENNDRFKTVNNSFVEGFNYALAIIQSFDSKSKSK